MKVRVIKGSEFDAGLARTWEQFRAGQPAMKSPFFAPAFFRCVARVRDDTRLAVVERDGAVRAFLPFHRRRFGIGKALGFPYVDYHGIVSPPDEVLDLRAVVRACGLHTLDFLYVPAAQTAFAPHVRRTEPSPIVRLDNYRDRTADWRKARKLEQELGQLEFRQHDPDRAAFDTLCEWKNAQCERTGFNMMLANAWLRDLLWEMVNTRDVGFAGALSTLRAGGRLLAVHAGPTSPSVWHWWFPAYSTEHPRHSPGLLLLLSMLRHGKAQGMDHLDFGTSLQPFKERFADDAVDVGQGTATASPVGAALLTAKRVARPLVRSATGSAFAGSALGWLRRRFQ